MNTEVELSGRELDDALFAALPADLQAEFTCDWCSGTGDSRDKGFNCEVCDGSPRWQPFSKSVDSLREVEARLIAAGWSITVNGHDDGWMARWWAEHDEELEGAPLQTCELGETEALARARSALSALRVVNSRPTIEPASAPQPVLDGEEEA